MYSFGNHGQWTIQVSGKLSAPEKQVSRSKYFLLTTILLHGKNGLLDALGSLRMVPTIVIAHTFCASRDTRISYR